MVSTLSVRGGKYVAEQRARVELRLQPGEPRPPSHLNEKELAEWDRFIPALAVMSILQPIGSVYLTQPQLSWTRANSEVGT